MDCIVLSLLQGIFPTQGSNPGLLHYRWILYHLSHQGSSRILEGAQLVKNPPAMQESPLGFLGGQGFPWRRDRLPTPVLLRFPGGSAGKESARNAGDLGSIPGWGRSPGGGKGYTPQYSGLENSMDCIVHGVMKSQTQLSDFTLTLTILLLVLDFFPLPFFFCFLFL